jgi:hypothetical protein
MGASFLGQPSGGKAFKPLKFMSQFMADQGKLLGESSGPSSQASQPVEESSW